MSDTTATLAPPRPPATPHAGPRARALHALPPRAVLLHAGQHKTGSTAIQNAVAAAPDVLRRAGWLYPPAGRVHDDITGHRHRQLMLEMRDRLPPTGWAKLRDSLGNDPARVLLSHEGFFSPQIDPAHVARQLPGRELHVLVYLRHPVDYIESSYREWVRRWGFAGTLREWYARRAAWLDVPALQARWEQALGPGTVHLRPYDTAHLHGGDVVTDLAHALGWPALPASPGPANRSLGSRQCLAHWMANRVKSPPGQAEALVDLLDACEADPVAADLLVGQAESAGLDAAQAQALAGVLAGVPHRARLVDDALAAQIERTHLAGIQRALAAQGHDLGAWAGGWQHLPHDPGADDPTLLAQMRTLLAA